MVTADSLIGFLKGMIALAHTLTDLRNLDYNQIVYDKKNIV